MFRYKPRRRRFDVVDPGLLDKITAIAAARHTMAEAASLLGCTHSCFENFIYKHPEAREAWKVGKSLNDASIRRLLYVHAKSDPATARFLAKNHLKMTDDGEQRGETPADAQSAMSTVAEAKRRIVELHAKLKMPGLNRT